jgi:hypothetical protein
MKAGSSCPHRARCHPAAAHAGARRRVPSGKGLFAEQLLQRGVGRGQRTFGQRAGVGTIGLQSRARRLAVAGPAGQHAGAGVLPQRAQQHLLAQGFAVGGVHACGADAAACSRCSAAAASASSTASFGQVGVPLHQGGPRAQAAQRVLKDLPHRRVHAAAVVVDHEAAAGVVARQVDLAHAGRVDGVHPGAGRRPPRRLRHAARSAH